MQITNKEKLSKLLGEQVLNKFQSFSKEGINNSLVLSEIYSTLKDNYEDMLYSQPNWTNNYSIEEINSARSVYKNAEALHLKKFHIEGLNMECIFAFPLSKNAETIHWLTNYALIFEEARIFFECDFTEKRILNADIKRVNVSNEGVSQFNVFNYVNNALLLTD